MKQLSLNSRGTKRPRRAFREAGVFDDEIAVPSGIINSANNCYASAVVHCLFNLSTITDVARELYRVHPDDCDSTCCPQSMIVTNSNNTTDSVAKNNHCYRCYLQCWRDQINVE